MQTDGLIAQAYNAQHVCKHACLQLQSVAFDTSASTNAALTDLEEGLQLSKVEIGVEARSLVPDGALLGGLDLVPVQLLQFAPLACCRPHLHSDTVTQTGWLSCNMQTQCSTCRKATTAMLC